MKLQRSSGVVLHPTSLPSGRLDADAYAFVDWLAAAGQSWWQVLPVGPPDKVGSPYAAASAFAAWEGFLADPDAPVAARERATFRRANAFWIEDWAAAGGSVDDQVRFDREWSALRTYAAERGVRLIGDVPIYVAQGSVDQLAHPELFLPGLVAGAPPDKLGPLGQHWGNPLFDWEAAARDGYRWWIERLRRTLALFDLTRIDHFRGFAAFWAIPEDAPDARSGRWLPGPGAAVFEAAEAELGPLPVIAEDLGLITPDVHALRDRLGFPGMVVLLWAFQGPASNPHRFENHREQQVIYTTTHDTDTLRGHFPRRDPWRLIEQALSSRAALAMVPVQDVLELGSEARMNTPGQLRGNWWWRLEPGQLTDTHAERLRALVEASGRL
jgi:4-alpha-glucanotransferase